MASLKRLPGDAGTHQSPHSTMEVCFILFFRSDDIYACFLSGNLSASKIIMSIRREFRVLLSLLAAFGESTHAGMEYQAFTGLLWLRKLTSVLENRCS